MVAASTGGSSPPIGERKAVAESLDLMPPLAWNVQHLALLHQQGLGHVVQQVVC